MYRYYALNKKLLPCYRQFHLSEFQINGLYCNVFTLYLNNPDFAMCAMLGDHNSVFDVCFLDPKTNAWTVTSGSKLCFSILVF